jgi:uncharacterized membrane protein YbhN (UPF0104 family)
MHENRGEMIENNMVGEGPWRKRASRIYSKGADLIGKFARTRWLRVAVQITVVGFCIFFLAANLTSARDILSFSRLDAGALVGSLIFSIVAVFLGTLGWWFTLLSFGHRPGWLESARVHLLANLAKYVPGYAWQLVGKAYLSKNLSLSARQSGLAMLAEFAQLILLGMVISFALLPQPLLTKWLGSSILANKILLAGVMIMIAAALLALLSRLRNHAAQKFKLRQINLALLASAATAILIGWLALGTAFWLLGSALMPVFLNDLPFFVFTLTASFIIGLAIVFVPGSIGVRESIIVLLLTARFPNASQAALIAIASRIIITVGELISTGVILALYRWKQTRLQAYIPK